MSRTAISGPHPSASDHHEINRIVSRKKSLIEKEVLELPDSFDFDNGIRSVEAVLQSLSGTTNFCTIMPIITTDGRERMKEVLSSEVHVVASKFGKMYKAFFLDEWYNQCLLPNVRTNSIVLLDSFPAHNDTDSM
ncbi:hypothetical protein BV898_13392 [Hypsibius exemplaris]|uniref:DDE-1 domain-containing protein n=1 Tax=Hypsibius exemplaris TaxID=2072580 RepID=A0A1W0WAX8_HYPEX|nr:hypothetical protein BV898_13392 [Hypsibius exemplaris]